MEDIKVNKITVNVDKKQDSTIISLYKTNQLLGTIDVDDLDIDSFQKSGVSLKAYQAYCKDIIINLIDNGGVQGFRYEPKEEYESVKYDVSAMRNKCSEYIANIFGDKYEHKMNFDDVELEIEKYKDMYIKNAIVKFGVSIIDYGINIYVQMEIKSGQACRPKVFEHNGSQYQFNITSINHIIKANS